MKHEYYIIVFKNGKTGEFKEYYQYRSPEEIEKKAIELRYKFYGKDEPIIIHIYKNIKVIYDDEQ